MDEALEDILKAVFNIVRGKYTQLPFQYNIKVYTRSKMAAIPKPPPPQIHSKP